MAAVLMETYHELAAEGHAVTVLYHKTENRTTIRRQDVYSNLSDLGDFLERSEDLTSALRVYRKFQLNTVMNVIVRLSRELGHHRQR